MADQAKELPWEQMAWIARQGLLPRQYEVLQGCPRSILVRNKTKMKPM